ncbi:Di-copper centre-containing protein [Rhizoclosmatium globosum]|uniref:Di-copper centre-containing protein n=1 Tax=Rhizoclosmatium globosum TaxID=329046 RepID=A0A1Y2C6Z8_9FUNG|nr:Di-copper centre-containing protein [Rhizoclosmatium globosum]|eukprot:ORY42808.1 Di-copper centre-containing protein [Rhizoclosmatium globosum]
MHSRLLLVFLVWTVARVTTAQCTNPAIRREWNELTPSQQQLYVDSIVRLQKRPASNQTQNASVMSYADFVTTHVEQALWTHGNAQFYPYHRAMMRQFELAMQSAGWSGPVPYWDWPSISQTWQSSSVFSYFGPAISTDPDGCLQSGPFAKGNYTILDDTFFLPVGQYSRQVVPGGDRSCLRRCGSEDALTDATVITAGLARASNYIEFRGDDRSGYHASGHVGTGGSMCGDMADGLFSTNDPLFFLHHGLVDKVWWRWQRTCPYYQFNYEGTLNGADDPIADPGDDTARSAQKMDSWSFWTVTDVLDTQGGVLCYTYSKSAGDLPIVPVNGCPPVPVVASIKAPTNTVPTAPAASLTAPTLGSSQIAQLSQDEDSQTVDDDQGVNGEDEPTTITDSADQPTDQDPTQEPTQARIIRFNQDNSQTTPSIQRRASLTNNPDVYTTTAENGTTTVHYPNNLQTITIPADYTLHCVYESNVVAKNTKTGLPRTFYPDHRHDYVLYTRVECAGVEDVSPKKDLCKLAKPAPLDRGYVESLGMDWVHMESNDNEARMFVDWFNCGCPNSYSPSQWKFQQA